MPDSPSKRAREAKKRRRNEEKQERKRLRKLAAQTPAPEGVAPPPADGTAPEEKPAPVDPAGKD